MSDMEIPLDAWTRCAPTEERMEFPADLWIPGHVTRVIDGDTVDLSCTLPCVQRPLVYRARLSGINAPELHTRDAAEKVAGLRSRDRLAELVEGHRVLAHVQGKDMYGRMLVELLVPLRGAPAERSALEQLCHWICPGTVRSTFRLQVVDSLHDHRQLDPHASVFLHVNRNMVHEELAVQYDGRGKRAPFQSPDPGL
jgi:hypothetical protein